ncbi:LLM class flavin-dependent oxidoreductase [Actinomadura sp. KC06]|uniref:LLM class flavin-dependent oxidoreductase n=1 Tax=Actinomadura sp. KC06 TaxID=2530369 RepID=UPI001052A484|nr:LLM class flavin-dependent oxidoreductase [Actinomadura sp. KC06]TDD34238.1 LLM class flavin-dependent oxidoreductase [Actinomadura sp. KC06]
MKFGLMYSFVVPPGSGFSNLDAYREMDELLPLAEELGFTSFHTTEHHFQFNGWAPSPLVVLGKAAGLTKTMRLATNILILPLYHPLRLAEDVATLDNLSEGRVTLGVSPGYVSEELAAFNVPMKERFGRFEEALDLLSLAWRGEEFTWEGKYFQVPQAKIVPKPVQERIPVWYGVSGPKLLQRAAERKVPVTASPRHTAAELVEHFAHYGEVAASSGYVPEERPVIREVFIAPTTEEAERLAGPAVTHLFSLYGKKSAQGERALRNDSGELISDESMVDFRTFSSRYVIADPETAIREIKELQATVQPTELICRMQLPGIPTRDLERSIRLFAQEIMPAFRD